MTQENFSFVKDKNFIQNYLEKMKLIISKMTDKEKKDSTEELYNMLERITKFDDGVLSEFDVMCKFTREKMKIDFASEFQYLDKFFENEPNWPVVYVTLDNLVFIMALVVKEVLYRLSVSLKNIEINAAYYMIEYLKFFDEYYKTRVLYENPNIADTTIKKYTVDNYGNQIAAYELSNIEVKQIEIEKTSEESKKLIKDGKIVVSKVKSESKRWEMLLNKNIEKISNVFEKFRASKKVQKRRWRILLIMMSVFLIIPPVYALWYGKNMQEYTSIGAYLVHISPLLAIEGLFIYFFKIILQRYHNLNVEIMQIDNRVALSRFIIPYTEYLKLQNPTFVAATLDKFNETIFKPIVNDSKDIPKITDGLSGLTQFIKSLRE